MATKPIRLSCALTAILALSGASAFADTTNYQYDALGRLTSVVHASGPQAAYTLDPAGNRTQVVRSGATAALNPPRLFFRNADGTVSSVLGGVATNLGLPGAGYTGMTARMVGDFNGDGQKDILAQRSSDGGTAMSLTNGTSITSAAWVTPSDSDVRDLGAADFDGDGKTDIFYGNYSTPVFGYHLNDGFSHTGGGSDGYSGVTTYQAVGDINHDGPDDVVFKRADGSFAAWMVYAVTVYYGWYKAPSWFAANITYGGSAFNPGSGWSAKAVANLTGDSSKDILARHTDGSFQVWEISSSLVITNVIAVTSPGSGWTFRGAVDVTGDGIAELLMSDASGNLAAWSRSGSTLTNLGNLVTPGATSVLLTENGLDP